MTENFDVGDIVKLKSGSPNMTVEEVGLDASHILRVWCSWYDGKEIKRDNFAAGAVELA